MQAEEFRRMYVGEFKPADGALYALVDEYVERCEAYDRTVCNGPIGPDGIMPASPRELGLVNAYAFKMHAELLDKAAALGFSRADVARAFKNHRPRSSAR